MNFLVVDDHPLVLEGIAQLIRHQFGATLWHVARTAAEAAGYFSGNQYDLVIVDINLPDRSGIDLVKEFRHSDRSTPVLVLSMLPETGLGVRCIKAGADGYVSKESPPGEFVEAVKKLLCGRKHFSSEVLFKVVQSSSRETVAAGHEGLSNREFQVMCMLSGGRSITSIAEGLGLSPNTVSTYRSRIFEKLGISSNAALTRYALQHGLI